MAFDDALQLGMVQGRLIQSPPNQLQWFPQDHWESEFFLAAALGFDFIEVVSERSHNPDNPLWTDDGIGRLKRVAEQSDRTFLTFCNDFVIDHALPGDDAVLKQNLELISRGAMLGCSKYVLPLFEHSELTAEDYETFLGPLRLIGDRAAESGITVCLETILNGTDLVHVLEELDHEAISAVFDTGNRIAFGHDLAEDIRRLGHRIAHVHIKDKNAKNENVLLGTGLVDFRRVFDAFKEIGYLGPYTFETTRGKDPLRTAAFNRDFLRFFRQESMSS